MEDGNIFLDIKTKDREFCKLIEEASDFKRDKTLTQLSDDYCQFLCDSIQILQKQATALEKVTARYPAFRNQNIACANHLRAFAKLYSDRYRSIEADQRRGIIPTNIPIFA